MPTQPRTRARLTTLVSTGLAVAALSTVATAAAPSASAFGGPAFHPSMASAALPAAIATTDARFFSDTTPAASVNWDYNPIEVGMKFSPATDGQLTGLSFYKIVYNYGPHTGYVYDANGTRLAAVTFSNETRSGWQHASFATALNLKAGQTYYVSYRADHGRVSYTTNGLAAPLTAGQLSTTAGAGMVRTFPNGVATTKVTNDNYWVDVHFRATASAPAPVSSPTPAPTTTQAVTRDKYKQPFASTSIWNMPVGSGAQYQALNLSAPLTGYGVVENYLSFDPNAPMRDLVDRGYYWPWTSGTTVPGSSTGIQVHIPDSLVIAPPPAPAFVDRPSAMLQADGKAREFQYTVRPTAGSNISMFEGVRDAIDLAGDGLSGNGAHGGSGMTTVGGVIRQGELLGDQPIRHALAVTMNLTKWGVQSGAGINQGYRWPASWADYAYNQTGFATGYGTLTSLGYTGRAGLGEGSLVALPANVDINSLGLETAVGKKIAAAYQNYGAYVVDNAGDTGSYDVHRLNIEPAAIADYPDIDTGDHTPEQTPFGRDMNKVFTRLAVITNNGPQSIGGGGTPRQPLAAPLGN